MQSVQDIVDEVIKKDNDAREHKTKNSWYPSELGQCLSGAYYKRLGTPQIPPDARLLRVFKVGMNDEDLIMNCIERSGVPVTRQVRIEIPEHNLTGYADGVIRSPDSKNDLALEIKSCHSQKFWRMKKEKKAGDWHHRMQLWCALEALQIAQGSLIYVSKDDLTIAEFPVFLEDPVLSESVLDELNILNEAWTLGRPPEPAQAVVFNETYGRYEMNWKAKYCNFHTLCTNNPFWLVEAEKEVQKQNRLKKQRDSEPDDFSNASSPTGELNF